MLFIAISSWVERGPSFVYIVCVCVLVISFAEMIADVWHLRGKLS